MKESIVKNKSYQFALQIIPLSRSLRKLREYEFASQVLRSGTSIGANTQPSHNS